jgi:hypothetical protein
VGNAVEAEDVLARTVTATPYHQFKLRGFRLERDEDFWRGDKAVIHQSPPRLQRTPCQQINCQYNRPYSK